MRAELALVIGQQLHQGVAAADIQIAHGVDHGALLRGQALIGRTGLAYLSARRQAAKQQPVQAAFELFGISSTRDTSGKALPLSHWRTASVDTAKRKASDVLRARPSGMSARSQASFRRSANPAWGLFDFFVGKLNLALMSPVPKPFL